MAAAAAGNNIVVVFDFDKTIIDCDSDNWVMDDLGVEDLFNHLLPTMPWNTLMDKMMDVAYSRGRSIHDVTESLKRVPLHPNMISAIRSAHALGCDLKIVSDANLFFVETVLKHHGLFQYFSEINTNPGFVDLAGRLRIFPYQHNFTTSPHCCTTADLCPPNMCKGVVIDRIKASAAFARGITRFIYLGDGKGDFCPSTRFREDDYVMPRKNYPFWHCISSNPSGIKAQIHEWSDWVELERLLLNLINKIINDTSVGVSSVSDCNQFHAIPISIQEPLLLPAKLAC